jgi:hypothetical protein
MFLSAMYMGQFRRNGGAWAFAVAAMLPLYATAK